LIFFKNVLSIAGVVASVMFCASTQNSNQVCMMKAAAALDVTRGTNSVLLSM
jgi:hypothetical protein